MSIFLFRFWPVLIPLLIYWLWHINNGRKAKKAGQEAPRFRDGPWYWAVISSLVIGFILFVFLGFAATEKKGVYIPPRMENGKLIDGQIK